MSKTADRILTGANEAVRRLNPHVFGRSAETKAQRASEADKTAAIRRVRQETKPLMNKLESDWFRALSSNPEVIKCTLRAQSKRLKLGNGVWYKPDMTALTVTGITDRETISKEIAWECKGPKQMKGMAKGMMTIKVAASQYPEIEFRLVWRESGQWFQQIVLP
jgi:hypothetical protein